MNYIKDNLVDVEFNTSKNRNKQINNLLFLLVLVMVSIATFFEGERLTFMLCLIFDTILIFNQVRLYFLYKKVRVSKDTQKVVDDYIEQILKEENVYN